MERKKNVECYIEIVMSAIQKSDSSSTISGNTIKRINHYRTSIKADFHSLRADYAHARCFWVKFESDSYPYSYIALGFGALVMRAHIGKSSFTFGHL
jgi:hypothetical protein